MAYGDPPWNGTWGQTLNYTYAQTSSGATTIPMTVYPTLVAVPTEPEVDDSPLAWLRGQVAEITELARAA